MKSFLQITLCIILCYTFSLAQVSQDDISGYVPIVASGVSQAIVGYGDQGVDITHSGEPTFEGILINFESIELENKGPNEWTVEWFDNEGELYSLINEEGDVVVIGPDFVQSIGGDIANTINVPESSVPDVIGDLAESLITTVDEAGGSLSLTGSEAYDQAVRPVTSAILTAQFDSVIPGQ